jgi:thymidylate synthase (FAD)
MTAVLISYSQSMNGTQTLQDSVAYCARVSNPENQNNKETNEKLLTYLIKHHHWSPFEMVSICLEIKTTRDIARQILRHRSFSFQEFSQRYAMVSNTFITKEARLQDLKNRQNSIVTDDASLQQEWIDKQTQIATQSQEVYAWALSHGIAKEQARAVLPEGMTPSCLYMNGTLRSWIHYLQLRTNMDTQKEHRDVAWSCVHAIAPIFPMILSLCKKSDYGLSV